ncbi:protein FAM227A-like [Acropora palmata]|uniref:protein FAM227A-like n=1 Tax=Acropora palmata TaxID=6131 RepID=UPI003DA0F794
MFVAEGEKVPDDLFDLQKSFHQGGTIKDITDQICSLNADLSSYDSPIQLVVDKYMREHGLEVEPEEEEFGYGKLVIDYKPPKKSTPSISSKEVEAKEVSKFAGVFSVRSALGLTSVSPLVDTVSQQSPLICWKNKASKKKEKSSSMKPMLVELHVYPGYEPDEVTPLPEPLQPKDILQTVINAQRDLRKKPSFKREFQSLVFSRISQDILQDLFWWYFLQKYQPSRNIQEMLFNRIAHNYVKMLFTTPVTQYRDKFLKRYPNIMAQAVYSTFCTAFPTSYKQFGDEFKEDLSQLITEWIAGTKPVPRMWDRWNFKSLEPKDMRKDEQIKQDASKGSLVHLPEENLSKQSSLSSVVCEPRQKSLPLIVEERAAGITAFKGGDKSKAVASQTSCVTKAQDPQDSFSLLAVCDSEGAQNSSSMQSLNRIQTKVSSFTAFTRGQKANRLEKRRESCPVGRGPEFSRSVFDVYGHSPLVEQFLRMRKLSKDCGTAVLIQRTEIKSLPPLSAPTYREVIRNSLKISNALTSDFKKLDEENCHQRTLFTLRQKEANQDFTRREGELLSRRKDVKKISELIYLELTKDGDEQSSGKVDAAIATAMGLGAENETN